MLDDDDDRFLYGDADETDDVSKPQPISLEQAEAQNTTNGVVAHLEAQVSAEATPSADEKEESRTPEVPKQEEEEEEEGDQEEEQEEEEEESDDDIEIIMELPTRSLDFRRSRTATAPTPAKPPTQPAPSLTTEYTPRDRNAVAKPSSTPQPTAPGSTPTPSTAATAERKAEPTDGVDTNTLPVATAPPSHPTIDPNVPGTLDGRSILEVDLNALADKPWRRPGSDISDWFNYGFDELSWEAYCYRRREVGDLATVLKTNVLNFAGMPEEQLAALPPEIRTMVMAGASAMMNQNNAGPGAAGMMPAAMNMPGAMMNPMMEMGPMMGPMMHDMDAVSMAMASQGMQGMGMPMGPGMGPGMGGQGMGQDMGGQGMPGQMGGQGMGGQGMSGPGMGGQGMGGQGMGGQGIGGQGMGGQGMGGQGMAQNMGGQGMGAQGIPVQGMGGQGMGGQPMNGGALSGGVGLSSNGPAQGQGHAQSDHGRGMGAENYSGTPQGQGMINMGGGEYPMQQDMGQQMYPNEAGSAPGQGTTPTRNVTPGQYRGRPLQQNVTMRGAPRGGYAVRGRVRAASPLPPNVPTGPRNKNKYKDIDGSAPAVDGLDYGGGKDRTTPPDHDDRSSRSKRRSSPGMDDGRSSKRR